MNYVCIYGNHVLYIQAPALHVTRVLEIILLTSPLDIPQSANVHIQALT